MDAGGFAQCGDCREFLWIGGDSAGLCAVCSDRAVQAVPVEESVERAAEPAAELAAETAEAPVEEPAPDPVKPGRAAKDVRKQVARKYEKGKLGTKPRRAQLTVLARKLWDERSADTRERLVTDLRAMGFTQSDPFEALLDLCEVTVRKTKSSMEKRKRGEKVVGSPKHR